MTLRQGVSTALFLGLLGLAFALMVGGAVRGGDWPGWDEGWAIVTFPLGIPVAVGAGLRAARGRSLPMRTALVTGAVWSWGALVFLVWLEVG